MTYSEQDAQFFDEQQGSRFHKIPQLEKNALGNPGSILNRARSQSFVFLFDVQIRQICVR